MIAFDDDGTPMIVGERGKDERRLVPAGTYANYDGISHDPYPNIISMIPANGWRIGYKDKDGSEWSQPLVGWGLKADGEIVPLDADSSGLVDDCEGQAEGSYRIYHPEHESSDVDGSAP